ncbi:MAG: alginate export family protein [Candidatus Omnitrophota bacterium]
MLYIMALSLLFSVLEVQAQELQSGERASNIERGRIIKDEATKDLKFTEKVSKKEADFTFDYGGWVFFDLEKYNDMDHNRAIEDWIKNDNFTDTRIYAKATFHQMVTFYGRFMNLYIDRPEVSSDYSGKGNVNVGPDIDMLYANLDLSTKFHVPLSITVGRQYFSIGKGITYSNTDDGILATYRIGDDIFVRGFVSQSSDHEYNVDYSLPTFRSANNRHYYGAEAAYLTNTVVYYVYGMIQDDRTRTYTLGQNYTYDSQYVGAGVSGQVGKAFSYWGEFIKEYGGSYTDAALTDLAVKDIDAYAFDVGANYKADIYSHPSFELEMAYGSGDKDRSRVTNTLGGNINGKDTNFMYFGTFNAGYNFVPRLSNMFIYKAEISTRPLEFIPHIGKNIAIGAKYYLYQKDKISGGVYDIYATEHARYIGAECDTYLHYKAYENLYFTVHCGIFFPGKAFPDGYKVNSTYVEFRTLFVI